MSRWPTYLAFAAFVGAGLGCGSGRHSSAGFRLPDDGDAERGKAAFVALGCHGCHRVSGVDLPQATAQLSAPVALGGEVDKEMTDGYLVTSITYPSHRLAHYPKDQIAIGGMSRMPLYTDRLTVRQLTDLVEFLQSRYTRRLLPATHMY
ncbi:MAG: c-type cytochrome, partial [Bryobacteraceae bacterium]